MSAKKKVTALSRSSCLFHQFDDPNEILIVRENLLSWYDANCRSLPWRTIAQKEGDRNVRGYAVWVSEIMLQQTQVATVIDYFNKWINKWPTVQDLSKASLEDVNKMWSGLGYYSRGRRLLEGAQKVVEKLDGELPLTSSSLMKELPGVGRYTAAAIASIAFNEHVGLVDGNVIRVISRMRRIGADSTSNEVIESIWSCANCLVDPVRPGDFNQALMELGATICSPKQPSCSKCPVAMACNAYKELSKQNEENKRNLIKGSANTIKDIEECYKDCHLCLPPVPGYKTEDGVMNYPRKPKKSSARQATSIVVVVSCKNKFCLLQRPPTGLLANLLEFPSSDLKETTEEVNKKIIQKILSAQFSIEAEDLRNMGSVVHLFSHIHQTYLVWTASTTSQTMKFNKEKYQKSEWLSAEEISKSAISSAMKKVFSAAQKSKSAKRHIDSPPPSSQKKIKDFFVRK